MLFIFAEVFKTISKKVQFVLYSVVTISQGCCDCTGQRPTQQSSRSGDSLATCSKLFRNPVIRVCCTSLKLENHSAIPDRLFFLPFAFLIFASLYVPTSFLSFNILTPWYCHLCKVASLKNQPKTKVFHLVEFQIPREEMIDPFSCA